MDGLTVGESIAAGFAAVSMLWVTGFAGGLVVAFLRKLRDVA